MADRTSRKNVCLEHDSCLTGFGVWETCLRRELLTLSARARDWETEEGGKQC